MSRDSNLNIKIDAHTDGASRGLSQVERSIDKLGDASGQLGKEAQQLRSRLDALGSQQKAIDSFRELKKGVAEVELKLNESEATLISTTAALQRAGQSVGDYREQQLQARRAIQESSRKLRALYDSLRQVKTGTSQVEKQSQSYKNKVEDLTEAINAERVANEELKDERTAITAQLRDAVREEKRLGVQLGKTEKQTIALSGSLSKKRRALRATRSDMQALGLNTSKLSNEQKRVKNSAKVAQRAIERLAQEVQSATESEKQLAESGEKVSRSHRKIGEGVGSISTQLSTMKTQLVGLIGVQALGGFLKEAQQVSEELTNLKGRLSLVVGEGENLEQAWNAVSAVALRTHSNLSGTSTLFEKIAQAGIDAGKSLEQASADALGLTETINQSIQISGASAQASEAAITQLVQGLQSGVLRGDEFNSVMEQAPRLARALAEGLGVTTGELRGMAEQGKLTAETVTRALQSQAQTIDREFASLPQTVGRSLTDLRTKWAMFVNDLDQSSGASEKLAQGIAYIADHLDDLARIAAIAGAALTANLAVKGVQALRLLSTQMLATAGSASVLKTNINKIPRAVNITIAAVGFEVGYEIGTMLHENTALARYLGVMIVGYYETIFNSLKLLKDASLALFNDDTLEASFKRYHDNMSSMMDSLKTGWEYAAKAPVKAADAIGTASTALAGAGVQAGVTAGALTEVGRQADTAASAIRALGEDAGTSIQTGTQNVYLLAQELARAGAESRKTRREIIEGLPQALQALSGSELARFRAAFVSSMRTAGVSARELREVMDAVSAQAAKSLGIDLVRASNKMSQEFGIARQNLSLLVADFDNLKARGVNTTLVLSQGLQHMMAQARNSKDIDALKQRIESLRDKLGTKIADGLLSQAAQKARELNAELDKTLPGVNSLNEAMSNLGLQSQQSLQQAADTAVQSFDTIKRAGRQEGESYVAWQERKRLAGEAMIKRMIEVNRGMVSAGIKTKAAAEGVTLAIDEQGKASIAAANAVSSAARKMQSDFAKTAAEAQKVAKQIQVIDTSRFGAQPRNKDFSERVNKKREDWLNSQRRSVDNGGVWSLEAKQKAGTLGASDVAAAQAALAAAKNNLQQAQSHASAVSFSGWQSAQEMVRRAQRVLDAARTGSAGRGALAGVTGRGLGNNEGAATGFGRFKKHGTASPAPQPNPAPTPAPTPSNPRVVEIVLGGNRQSVAMSSDADADKLLRVLEQLQGVAA